MKYKFPFEKLEVWKDAMNLVKNVYELTRKMPEEEKFGLTNQTRRSAVSVPANIAEGSSRLSGKSQKNFYQIAYSSLMELYSHLLLAEDLEMIAIPDELIGEISLVSSKLNRLYNSTRLKV